MGEIKGLDKLLKKLDSLGGNSTKALEVGVLQATKKVQADAKLLCPVREEGGGHLRNSIQATTEASGNGLIGKVSTNIEYAPYVEFGTGQRGNESPAPPKWDGGLAYRQDWKGMPAHPFLYPALIENKEKVKEIIANHINKEIEKLAIK